VPEVERGFNMSWQSVPRLVNLVGQSIAKRFILFAERLNSQRGLDWVLADEVAEDGGAVKIAMKWATRIATILPVQVRMVKQGIAAFLEGRDSNYKDYTDLRDKAVYTTNDEQEHRLI
jgi:enoyl-CoA hydratase/carnithine racemase